MNVQVDGVRMSRGGRDVLAVASLHVRADRTTAVLGPNGAGKTSLLRLIAGLDRPDAGSVQVGGLPADRQVGRVAYVFQEQVFLRRTLLDNVALGLRARGIAREQAYAQASEALAWLRIEALANRQAHEISGGEARRASLARALALGAPLLLLDEPMAGLDGSTYARLLDELPELLAGHRATSVIVTHAADEAFRLADDLIVLVDGRVAAAGTTQEVATHPRRADVARVLGYTVLDAGGRHIAVPPRAVRVGAGGETFRATVEGVIDLVSEWEIVVAVADARLRVPLDRRETPPRPGDTVPLRLSIAYALDD